jgi:hypothetical protein
MENPGHFSVEINTEAMLAYQHEQQALRINKAASPIWMQQAEIAFADYWARYVSAGVYALA